MRSSIWTAPVLGILSLALNPAGLSAATPKPIMTSGQVDIDLHRASLRGNVCLTNRPANAMTHFALHAGLNVGRVRDGEGKSLDFDGWYSPKVDGEALVYEIAAPGPATLCVEYVGQYPSYPKHDGPDDFKGLIGFDGQSVRASEQTAWLPAPYDASASRRLATTAYDLNVTCLDCRFIYLNGLAPRSAAKGRFRSDLPRPPLLFAGKGPWQSSGRITVVNETLPQTKTAVLSKIFAAIARFYEDYLGSPYPDKPVLLRMVTMNQIDRDRKGNSWGFATWPTIALSGSVKSLADGLIASDQKNEYIVPYLAHESAHYYFGTLNQSTGPYRWMLLESMAEFLGVQTQRKLAGDGPFQRRLARMLKDARSLKDVVPLNEIKEEDQITSSYRYSYIPLLLLALEKRTGPDVMRDFVRTLLRADSPQTWQEMSSLARRSGIRSQDWDDWEHHCLSPQNFDCLEDLVPAAAQ